MFHSFYKYFKPIHSHRLFFIISGYLFWLLLDIGYRVYVSELFNYSGFFLKINIIKYLESILIYSILLIFAPKNLNLPSDFFINFLLFGLITPILVFYSLSDQSRYFLYIILLGYFILKIFRKGKRFKIPLLKKSFYISIILLILVAFLVSLWMLISGSVENFNIDQRKIYEFRELSKVTFHYGVMGYLNNWAYTVAGPTLIAITLWKKNLFSLLILVFLHLFWFGISSHKVILFYPILIIFIYVFFSKFRSLSIIPFSFFLVLLFSLFAFLIFENILIPSLFIRRAFFVLANNVFNYYYFFHSNEFVYWSNSLLSSYIQYPYDLSPANLIGDVKGSKAHVNSSFLSTGFMHAGIIGVVFYSLIASIIFRFIDSLSLKQMPIWVAISVLIVPIRSLLFSSDLPTAFLTHGIAFGIIILFFLRSKKFN